MVGKLKVVHVIGKLCFGGAQESLLQLAGRLDSARFESVVVSLGAENEMLGEFRRAGLRTALAPAPHRWGPAGLWRLASLLRREQAQILHSHARRSTTPGMIAALLAGTPVRVAHYRSMSPEDGRGPGLAERWLAAAASRAVAVSEPVAEQLKRQLGLDPWRVTVIPNGVDLERFAPAPRAPARAALGLLASDFVVGFVGRLEPVKRLPVLLRAAAAARSAVPDLRVVLAGDGDERAALAKLAAELGIAERVTFLGMRRDLPAVYPAMDVLCLPSRAEGCSRVLLEAAACGVPLLATPVGAAPEVLGRGEEAGLLFPVDDVGALAAALARLAREPEKRAEMSAAAGVRARRWSLAGHVRLVEQLYTELWEARAP